MPVRTHRETALFLVGSHRDLVGLPRETRELIDSVGARRTRCFVYGNRGQGAASGDPQHRSECGCRIGNYFLRLDRSFELGRLPWSRNEFETSLHAPVRHGKGVIAGLEIVDHIFRLVEAGFRPVVQVDLGGRHIGADVKSGIQRQPVPAGSG